MGIRFVHHLRGAAAGLGLATWPGLLRSWADVREPEQLEPGVNQRKWSVSAIYTRRFGADGLWSTTAAWGRRTSAAQDFDAWTLESAVKPNAAWTVFARAEHIETDELTFAGGHQLSTVTWDGKQRIDVWTDKGKTVEIAVNGKDLGAYSPAMGHPDWNRIDFSFWAGFGQ